jgi:hypothetical protein
MLMIGIAAMAARVPAESIARLHARPGDRPPVLSHLTSLHAGDAAQTIAAFGGGDRHRAADLGRAGSIGRAGDWSTRSTCSASPRPAHQRLLQHDRSGGGGWGQVIFVCAPTAHKGTRDAAPQSA